LLVAVVMAMGYFRQRVFGLQETSEPTEAAAASDALRRRGERRKLAPAVYAWSRPRRRSRPHSQPAAAATGASASRV
jgi:hypothetical protein